MNELKKINKKNKNFKDSYYNLNDDTYIFLKVNDEEEDFKNNFLDYIKNDGEDFHEFKCINKFPKEEDEKKKEEQIKNSFIEAHNNTKFLKKIIEGLENKITNKKYYMKYLNFNCPKLIITLLIFFY